MVVTRSFTIAKILLNFELRADLPNICVNFMTNCFRIKTTINLEINRLRHSYYDIMIMLSTTISFISRGWEVV